ncbi:hypothetical protein NQ317_013258 [Molorchus minor]|uniref:Uncharacterized protein n=1 Tax=Molorchus minor TaxID=1323400 RepID=A0ABQ9JY99_9CUCU|nr:hypothetical protein NQ317_013258 [Molorchus minor]
MEIFNYESLVHATAGATGSIFAMISLYPLDNIKFRMQLDDKELLDKSTLQALIHLAKTEGMLKSAEELAYNNLIDGLIHIGKRKELELSGIAWVLL